MLVISKNDFECKPDITEKNLSGKETNCTVECHHYVFKCDFHVCSVKVEGFLKPNGTFHKIAFEELLERNFEKDTDVSDVLKERCLSEELDAFIQEDSYYLKYLGNCLSFYGMLTCKNWNESDDCKKIKTELDVCQKL